MEHYDNDCKKTNNERKVWKKCMGEIQFENVCKSFGTTNVIENLNLTIKDGEFTVLVGPSGCGKTTLLRIIAGIGPATSGKLYIEGEEVSGLPPGQRDIAMVFQNYAIYPTMTVKGNIEFGLINKKVPKEEREKLISSVVEIVGLTPYLKRKPNALSGGQRQRVALARAMVKNPSVFLLDEPLSNLDAMLRGSMRVELIELHNRLKATFVYVTHDQTEAMSMADTIVLMNQGEIQQIAAPEVIYTDPDNIFTAQFIGTPPMNVIQIGKNFLGFRPEHIVFNPTTKQGIFHCTGTVITREMLGSETLYKVEIDKTDENGQSYTIMVKISDRRYAIGDSVKITVADSELYHFNEQEKRIREKEQPELFATCVRAVRDISSTPTI
jgi:sn-glycerol 3-phosphate transport system ATP-binding protein